MFLDEFLLYLRVELCVSRRVSLVLQIAILHSITISKVESHYQLQAG